MFRAADLKKTGVALAAIGSVASAQPAFAQWNYNPFNGNSTWLGVSRLLNYPLSRASTSTSPFYLASPVVRWGTYYAGQGIVNGVRQSRGSVYAQDQIMQRGGTAVPSDAQPVTDQVSHMQPYRRDSVAAAAAQDREMLSRAPGAPGVSTAPGMPPAAPPITGPTRSAPLAAGFITVVNERFQGDISKALFDPETRSYAKAIGLVDGDDIFNTDLGAAKIQTIRSILADEHEDATVRINAVRMLLKH